MFRWRASLWKTVWAELLIYLLFYLAISLIYRFWSTILSEYSLIFPIKGLSWCHLTMKEKQLLNGYILKRYSLLTLGCFEHLPGCFLVQE